MEDQQDDIREKSEDEFEADNDSMSTDSASEISHIFKWSKKTSETSYLFTNNLVCLL